MTNSDSATERSLLHAWLPALLFSVACMSILVCYANVSMDSIASEQAVHGKAIVPAKMLAAKFDNALLDARIGFIYFVTIQKPGSLEHGLGRYQEAEASLAALTALTQQREQLSSLKAPVAQLQTDLDAYHVELLNTLQMVQGGTLNGPAYDEQVKTWAAKGGKVVLDANSVEDTCFAISQNSTGVIANQLKTFKLKLWCVFAGCCFLFATLIFFYSRRAGADGRSGLSPAEAGMVPTSV